MIKFQIEYNFQQWIVSKNLSATVNCIQYKKPIARYVCKGISMSNIKLVGCIDLKTCWWVSGIYKYICMYINSLITPESYLVS